VAVTARSKPRWTCGRPPCPGIVVRGRRTRLDLEFRAEGRPLQSIAGAVCAASDTIWSAFFCRRSRLIRRNDASWSSRERRQIRLRPRISSRPSGERVGQLDSAVEERLREHPVVEAGDGFVAGLILRVQLDRRVQSGSTAARRGDFSAGSAPPPPARRPETPVELPATRTPKPLCGVAR